MSPVYHQLLVLPPFACFSYLGFACFAVFVAFISFCLFPGGLAWALSKKSGSRAAIPGPSGFPLAGLLHVFNGSTPHRVLAKLAQTFNASPLMAFSVGVTRFVISSNPDTAKEILGSTAFADRPVKESAYELLFHRAMGFAPYGEYWRNLRRISSTHLFSPKRINAFDGFRSKVGLKMVREIQNQMCENNEVGVKHVLHCGSLNNVMMTVFGRCYDFDTKDGVRLEKMVSEGYELLGIFNWSDHFPIMGMLDLQGVRKRCKLLVSEVNKFVGQIIDDHRTNRAAAAASADDVIVDDSAKDFVDVLLDMEESDKLSDSDMIAVLWEMIFRGTDTVAILLEWILARMVMHPEIQAKAQAEIDAVTATKPVSGADIAKMAYLQSIVKETLRVHPPGPLLSWARLAVHDVHVGGNFIPAGTTAMVNMWSITHDDRIWSEPEKFIPERFIEEDVSIMGSDLRLAPFGSGRRVCPGKAMGLASVHLWLAQMLQNFKWVANETGVDLSESLKLSLEMKAPLCCKAIPRVI